MKAILQSKRILVLYWHPGPGELRLAISRHLHALDWSGADHQVLYFNALNGVPRWLGHFKWDVVVFHTTLLCLRWSHLFHKWKWHIRWLNDCKCLKVALPQDEYDHAHVLDEWLFELGVHLIFTNFGEKYRQILYPLMHDRAIFHQCLTGYIDERDAEAARSRFGDTELRTADIIYRATHLPFWFGTHGQLKHRIAEEVATRAQAHGLHVDISTRVKDTIVGPAWLEFLASGRTVIGSESGSSVLDARGALKARLQQLSLSNPELTFERASSFMPPGWDQYEFFAISPRHFEAVLTRTCQVLVEGTYDGVLQPRVHYLPVRRDFSNLDEVLKAIKNRSLVDEVSRRAYRDVFESGRYTYRRFARELDDAMQAAVGRSNVHVGGPLAARARVVWPVAKLVAHAAEVDRLTRYRLARAIVTSPLYWCFLRHPLVCLAKAYLALRLIAESPPLLKLLRVWWSHRAAVAFRHVLMDSFMLGVLRRVRAEQVQDCAGIRIHLDLHSVRNALILRSDSGVPMRDAGQSVEDLRASMAQMSPLMMIVWDHSAVGREILFPIFRSKRISLSLGPRGVYEFKTLPFLYERSPNETLRALFQQA